MPEMRPTIFDLTLRDGLMDRPLQPVDLKVELVEHLLAAGLNRFEVARFPLDGTYAQFADALDVLAALQPLRGRGARLAVFAMGDAGLDEAARHVELFDEVHTACFASDDYALYALGSADWGAQLRRLEGARSMLGAALTVGIGCFFGCPLARGAPSDVPLRRLGDVVALGVDHVMLGDTAGMGHPGLVREVVRSVLSRHPGLFFRVHFHDTFGRALLNTIAALDAGCPAADVSLLGLGGEAHPYFLEPQLVANGNCATEELVDVLAAERPHAAPYDRRPVFGAARTLARALNHNKTGRACHAELVPVGATNEVPQRPHRH